MALFSGDIRSHALGMDTRLQVVLPYDRPSTPLQAPCKVLYLLHGLGDNAATWCQRTCVEKYARDAGLAVIMPEVQRSFYIDMELGLQYGSYITKELPELCTKLFNISTKREDTFIAGLSMGGYGALRSAFSTPERYAACASFSGALDLHDVARNHVDRYHMGEFQAVFGVSGQIAQQHDLRLLAKRVCELPSEQRPRLLMTCGQQDYLYEMNLHMKAYFESLSLNFTYREWPGEHAWDFWDASVRYAMAYFLSPQNADNIPLP